MQGEYGLQEAVLEIKGTKNQLRVRDRSVLKCMVTAVDQSVKLILKIKDRSIYTMDYCYSTHDGISSQWNNLEKQYN